MSLKNMAVDLPPRVEEAVFRMQGVAEALGLPSKTEPPTKSERQEPRHVMSGVELAHSRLDDLFFLLDSVSEFVQGVSPSSAGSTRG